MHGSCADVPCMEDCGKPSLLPRNIHSRIFRGCSAHGRPRKTFAASADHPGVDLPWMFLARKSTENFRCFRGTSIHGSSADVPRTEDRGKLLLLPRIIRAWIFRGCSVHGSPRKTFAASAEHPFTDLPQMFRTRKTAEDFRCFRRTSMHESSADVQCTDVHGCSTDFHGTSAEDANDIHPGTFPSRMTFGFPWNTPHPWRIS